MKDVIIEPIRSMLIPYFAEMKQTALDHNAIGFGISGSGPSVFALCKIKMKPKNSYRTSQAALRSEYQL